VYIDKKHKPLLPLYKDTNGSQVTKDAQGKYFDSAGQEILNAGEQKLTKIRNNQPISQFVDFLKQPKLTTWKQNWNSLFAEKDYLDRLFPPKPGLEELMAGGVEKIDNLVVGGVKGTGKLLVGGFNKLTNGIKGIDAWRKQATPKDWLLLPITLPKDLIVGGAKGLGKLAFGGAKGLGKLLVGSFNLLLDGLKRANDWRKQAKLKDWLLLPITLPINVIVGSFKKLDALLEELDWKRSSISVDDKGSYKTSLKFKTETMDISKWTLSWANGKPRFSQREGEFKVTTVKDVAKSLSSQIKTAQTNTQIDKGHGVVLLNLAKAQQANEEAQKAAQQAQTKPLEQANHVSDLAKLVGQYYQAAQDAAKRFEHARQNEALADSEAEAVAYNTRLAVQAAKDAVKIVSSK
jgi:hypothetical protein